MTKVLRFSKKSEPFFVVVPSHVATPVLLYSSPTHLGLFPSSSSSYSCVRLLRLLRLFASKLLSLSWKKKKKRGESARGPQKTSTSGKVIRKIVNNLSSGAESRQFHFRSPEEEVTLLTLSLCVQKTFCKRERDTHRDKKVQKKSFMGKTCSLPLMLLISPICCLYYIVVCI